MSIYNFSTFFFFFFSLAKKAREKQSVEGRMVRFLLCVAITEHQSRHRNFQRQLTRLGTSQQAQDRLLTKTSVVSEICMRTLHRSIVDGQPTGLGQGCATNSICRV